MKTLFFKPTIPKYFEHPLVSLASARGHNRGCVEMKQALFEDCGRVFKGSWEIHKMKTLIAVVIMAVSIVLWANEAFAVPGCPQSAEHLEDYATCLRRKNCGLEGLLRNAQSNGPCRCSMHTAAKRCISCGRFGA